MLFEMRFEGMERHPKLASVLDKLGFIDLRFICPLGEQILESYAGVLALLLFATLGQLQFNLI